MVELKFHANFHRGFSVSLVTFEEKGMTLQGHFHKKHCKELQKTLKTDICIISNLL